MFSDTLFFKIFVLNPDPSVLFSVETDSTDTASDLKILDCNLSFQKMVRQKKEEIIGKSFFNIIPQPLKSDKAFFKIYDKISNSEDSFSLEFFSKALRKWYDILLISPEKGFLLMVYKELSPKKFELGMINSDLNKQFLEMLRIQEMAHLGIWEFNLKTLEMKWTEEVFRIAGIPHVNNFFFGDKFRILIRPEERKNYDEKFRSAKINGQRFQIETRLLRPSGEIRIVYIEGDPKLNISEETTDFKGFIYDITDLRNSMEKLDKSEFKLNFYIENAPFGVVVSNDKGEIIDTNPVASKLAGLSKDELKKKTLFDFLSPESLILSEQLFFSLMEKGIVEGELSFRRNNGEERFIFIQTVRLSEDVNVSYIHDITEKKKIEENLLRAKEEAESANAVKSSFLACVSHELRTPMNGIAGFIDLLAETDLDEEQKEYALYVKRSSQSLIKVINMILDLSKIEAGKAHISKSEFSLRKAVAKVVSFFSVPMSEKHLSFKQEIGEDVPDKLSGDSDKIMQVLTNLLDNAVKFTPQGRIILRIKREEDIFPYFNLRFEVEDTGIGFSNDLKEEIFKPFSQIDDSLTRKFGGLGLGLSISNKLVKILKGEIFAANRVLSVATDSAEGKGSLFVFRIPLEENAGAENHLSSGTVSEVRHYSDFKYPESKKIKALIAEDNEISSAFFYRFLKTKNILSDFAEDGKAALKLFKERKYDIIFMNCQMPVMDGFEATKKIREYEEGKTRVPIVAITAYALTGEKEQCLKAGMDDYISKPIDPEMFMKTILRLCPPEPGIN